MIQPYQAPLQTEDRQGAHARMHATLCVGLPPRKAATINAGGPTQKDARAAMLDRASDPFSIKPRLRVHSFEEQYWTDDPPIRVSSIASKERPSDAS